MRVYTSRDFAKPRGEHITTAAIRRGNRIFTGGRHVTIYAKILEEGLSIHGCDSGFMTSHDRFVSRKEAARIAFESGQVEYSPGELHSEDLY